MHCVDQHICSHCIQWFILYNINVVSGYNGEPFQLFEKTTWNAKHVVKFIDAKKLSHFVIHMPIYLRGASTCPTIEQCCIGHIFHNALLLFVSIGKLSQIQIRTRDDIIILQYLKNMLRQSLAIKSAPTRFVIKSFRNIISSLFYRYSF